MYKNYFMFTLSGLILFSSNKIYGTDLNSVKTICSWSGRPMWRSIFTYPRLLSAPLCWRMFPEWFDISMSFRQKKLRRPMQRMAIRKKVKLQEITKKF